MIIWINQVFFKIYENITYLSFGYDEQYKNVLMRLSNINKKFIFYFGLPFFVPWNRNLQFNRIIIKLFKFEGLHLPWQLIRS